MLVSNESKQVLYARFTQPTPVVDPYRPQRGATGGIGAQVANRWRVSAAALAAPTIRYSGSEANQHVYSRFKQMRG